METIKNRFISYIRALQDQICDGLVVEDGKGIFREDNWTRPGGGGGRTRVLENGAVFEKAGVNTSEVEGIVTSVMQQQLNIRGEYFFAAGLSLVLHPLNPFVPTIHANFRYFELYDEQKEITDSWFGGGTDLTPYYLFDDDAILFHGKLKEICDRFDDNYYSVFKKHCDEYFVNKHRQNEARGIGGIFFDYLRADEKHTAERLLEFSTACGNAFLEGYLPIVQKRKVMNFTPENKYWQEIRRGRYTEFNLVHDRGTLFGLKTNGRTESILMSLPPTVRFDYDHHPASSSEEERLLNICRSPIDWLS